MRWKTELPEAADIVIVGAGFAGAATAWFLARRGVRALVLDRESLPGVHSSGLCAGIVRQPEPTESLVRLVRRGIRMFGPRNGGLGRLPFHGTGSLSLVSRGARVMSRRRVEWLRSLGVSVELLSRDEARQRHPLLGDRGFHAAIWCPDDGFCNPISVLNAYIRGATKLGARFAWDTTVEAIVTRDGEIAAVETSRGTVAAEHLVLAAGAWAGRLGALCGAPLPLQAYRRHLALSVPSEEFDRTWPVVWDRSHHTYFRWESGSLLLCPCDQEAFDPGRPPVSWDRIARIGKVGIVAPELSRLRIAHAWAGLRTFAPDGRPCIGPDPRVEGLHWVAGLGGFGMAGSGAVGELAADRLMGRRSALNPQTFDPVRLLDSAH